MTTISGIGTRRAQALGVLHVHTVLDLLMLYPRRYIDRTNQATIRQLRAGEEATLLVRVRRAALRQSRGGKAIVEADVSDASGRLQLTFFNQRWRIKDLPEGAEIAVFGRFEVFRGTGRMTNPVVDLVGDRTARIIPVYRQSEKARLMTWEIAAWVSEALERAGELADPLPAAWATSLGLAGRSWSFRQIHAPDSIADKDAARKRLAFDELLRLQVVLVQRKRRLEATARGIRHQVDGDLLRRFRAALPYELTAAQLRAMAEIAGDMAAPHPMHRLLQGDVGSGKTLVAVAALLTAVQGGHQGAMLAPTEVLAEQHDATVRALMAGLTVPAADQSLFPDRPVKTELLTGRTPAGERARLAAALAGGTVDIVVGTHALLSAGVAFADLGMVVVDEQHRFGVEQRSILRDKGLAPRDLGEHGPLPGDPGGEVRPEDDRREEAGAIVPDVLVMTATPIPRTAAMTVYGDLDLTVLDELPPGRTPITTVWANGESLAEAEAWDQVRSQVAAGRQAYVVCPLVEESERTQAASAVAEHARLAAGELAGLRLGLVHGQLPSRDKEAAMEAFRSGVTEVLVATTVIEVGVDVPNATVMVILDADRFGIAQLHQLRGRVGRGAARAWCYLLGAATTEEGEARLRAVVDSGDGFHLAERDLQLRGEGTILGARQKGRNDLRLASLRDDRELIEAARRVAMDLVGDGTGLAGHPVLAAEVRELVDDDEAEFLFKS